MEQAEENESFYIRVETCTPVGKNRIRIRFEGGDSCLLYRGECRRLRLGEGGYLSEEEYRRLMTEILGKRARKRALHILESMDRSERKLRELLERSEYPQTCIEDAIAYVKGYHYLDDERFASEYVRYRQERMSRGQLKQKLVYKGIQPELAERVLDTEYEGDEAAQIRRWLEKRKFDAQRADRKEFERTYRFLMRRGFSGSQVLGIMKTGSRNT